MRKIRSHARLGALAPILALALASPASADLLNITVTNDQPGGGFALSQVWFGAQDGTFSTFTSGGAETGQPIESVAELGDPTALQAAFAGHGSQTVVGPTPITPGLSISNTLDVADPTTDRYLSFGAMVVPSNDFFMGNADPKAFALFDASGHFNGPLTINIYGGNVWDSGTEVDNINFGAAFIVGDDATDHVAENGTASLVFGGNNDLTSYLDSILGKATAGGYDISHLISPEDLVATITITAVPEPSSLALGVMGAIGLLAVARKAHKAKALA
jgi:hypothetical protein